MNCTKRYEFILDKPEISEFCRVAMIEQLKCKKKMWLRLAVILILELVIMPEAAALIVFVMALLILAVAVFISANIKKSITGQKWMICIEDGIVKANRGVGGEIPCSRITLIRTTPHLLLFGYMQTAEQPAWYIIPLRSFADKQEQELFIDRLRNPWQGENTYLINDNTDRKTDDSTTQAYLRFAYELNEEKWVHFQKEASGIIFSNTIGKTGRIRKIVLFTFFMMTVLMLVVYFAAGRFNWQLAVYSVLIAVFLTMRLFFRDPERGLRKQVKSPAVRDRVCGKWQIALKDEGVEMDMPMGMKNFYPWESLEWLVETGDAFYFFHKDKKHYSMIQKECFQDTNQVSVLHQLCAQKGIKAVQGKKMRYVPDWLFYVLLAAVIVVYTGTLILSIYIKQPAYNSDYMEHKNILTQESSMQESSMQESLMQESLMQESSIQDVLIQETGQAWDGAEDYPNYTPLDRQVEVLSSLGYDVPVENVEQLRRYMTEYGHPEQVEGYPYAWILMQLGAPEYDDNFEVSKYSDDVYWFDFEGLDISTDYVTVLNGMRALAGGSTIDNISEIKEDTSKVSWEEGSGIITVSLTLNGAEYAWDMQMHYDWIDTKVLGIFNELLEQENSEKRFYDMGDNGQGAIVFFCTKEWAEEFMDATGLELESYNTPFNK